MPLHDSKAMTNTLQPIDLDSLHAVTGGGAWDTVSSAVGSGVNAVRNFGSGFAAGAVHGPGMKNDSVMAQGLDRNATGTKPGVELGMMTNMALGPVGDLMSAAAGTVPTGAK